MPTPNDDREPTQVSALQLSVTQAEDLLARVRTSRFLLTYGIEVYTVPSANKFPRKGDLVLEDQVYVMVRADSDLAAGKGVGYLTAIFEDIVRR